MIKTQYITDGHGKKVAVILPVKDFERLMDERDELECIKAYDKAKPQAIFFTRCRRIYSH